MALVNRQFLDAFLRLATPMDSATLPTEGIRRGSATSPGSGKAEILFNYVGDGNWWLGGHSFSSTAMRQELPGFGISSA